MNSKIEKIICDDSQNISKWHKDKNIALSIIKPPYITDEDLNDDYLIKFQNIMNQVVQVTKPGGISCLILEEDKNSNQKMSSVSNKIILQITDQKNSENWEKREEIIWVKSSKSSTESLNPMESGILINFEETPFSTIHVFQKSCSEFEYIDSEERVSKLNIDEKIKEEWSDSVWFVQPTKELEFQERIPREILTRLIRIFSNENEIILDPYAGFGGTCIVSKLLKRDFLCLDKNVKKISMIKKRLKIKKK